jgi:antirestriction protein ArdC
MSVTSSHEITGAAKVLSPVRKVRAALALKHDSRQICKRFGDEGYAVEELVAELGSAFLSADIELTLVVRDDHASYIPSWIKALKNDTRAIFTAALHAQRATDFLQGLQKSASSHADAA